jgi:hypothetical protein
MISVLLLSFALAVTLTPAPPPKPSRIAPVATRTTARATSRTMAPVAIRTMAPVAIRTIAPVATPFASIPNLIVNGDFAKNPCGTQRWCASTDSSLIAPWTVVDDKKYEIDLANTFPNVPFTAMDLNSDGPITLQQTVAVEVNSSYSVTFWLNQNPFCGQKTMTMFVGVEGSDLQLLTGNTNVATSNTVSTTRSLSFTAISDTIKLSFGSTTPGSCGPVIFKIVMVKGYPVFG